MLCCFALFFILIIPSAASAASLNKHLNKYGPEKHAIIYGRIDCTPAKAYLDGAAFVRQHTKYPDYYANHNEILWRDGRKGYFLAFVTPGKYYLHHCTVQKEHGSFLSGNPPFLLLMPYKDKEYVNSKVITVNAGDVVYWGNAKIYKTKESGMFKSSEYGMAPEPTSEARSGLDFWLQDAKGTAWEPLMKKKIDSVPKDKPKKEIKA